ncbi:hypothetical protein [Methylobacterium sp. Leaf117]|uniref:hypothetical protein n=1 Tax=Methylobacterium sp. Leaf117 TaxID=1736260 RepID=UPI0006F316CD|nr:hypothetical protein [Methylobacterium sp. Leaf117]KQP82880.1 hypothetical protein ASF57_12150 [Methylobacterium sp. Leaf117]
MGVVIDIEVARDVRAGDAFAEYVSLKNRADTTLRILDMLAAARAWERFIHLAIPNPRERLGLL